MVWQRRLQNGRLGVVAGSNGLPHWEQVGRIGEDIAGVWIVFVGGCGRGRIDTMSSYHQHRFGDVESYLHHRPPYLLVQRIESIEDRLVRTSRQLTGDEPFLQGHFPGAPIMPGAMMQEMTTQTAGILIAANFNPMPSFDTTDPFHNEFALGVLVKIRSARYRGFARPGETLVVTAELTENIGVAFDFVGRVMVGDKTIMRNEFQLSNIPSKQLQGVAS